jgi:hypothetical protein
MGTDVEVRQGRPSRAPRPAVAHEAFPGQERRVPGERFPAKAVTGEHGVELLDALEADRDLGVHDGVDD